MGRRHSRPKRTHAEFPIAVGGSGLICGAKRAGAIVSADPRKVDCQTCRAYMERHPEQFPAWDMGRGG